MIFSIGPYDSKKFWPFDPHLCTHKVAPVGIRFTGLDDVVDRFADAGSFSRKDALDNGIVLFHGRLAVIRLQWQADFQ